jgi:hypothetical protein
MHKKQLYPCISAVNQEDAADLVALLFYLTQVHGQSGKNGQNSAISEIGM